MFRGGLCTQRQPVQGRAGAERDQRGNGAEGDGEAAGWRVRGEETGLVREERQQEVSVQMKLAHFSEIIASIAKNHPEAEVVVSYPARHAGKPTTRRGTITGYRTSVSDHPAVTPTLWIEIEHSRSGNVKDE